MFVVYLFIFVFGLVIGSFLNVCIYRIPAGKSIVSPPSACTSCGNRLSAPDLIPVVSYIYLKGRCRHCGAVISPRYPLIELLTGLVFIAVFFKYGISVPFLAFIYLMAILIAVLFIDAEHRIIPDELVITGIIGGAAIFLYNIFKPLAYVFGDDKWWTPLVGFFSASGFLFLVAVIGSLIYKTDDAMGMGDVKLMAPIGLFLGWKLCLLALFISIIFAGFTSLFLIIFGLKKKKDTIPFGPFIVAGSFIALMWGWDILNWYFGSF